MSKNAVIHILNKRLSLHQAPDGFRTSMDSIILGASCPAKSGQSILDLGCGVGSAGLCALFRIQDAPLTGVDIQESHIDLAQKNAADNDMEDRATFLCADIREELNIPTFNHVICNPPYKEAGAHKPSPSAAKAQAMGHQDDDLTLDAWTTRAWHHIKGQGSLTIIHEAGKTDELIRALYSTRGAKRFGHVEIFPLYPKEGMAAKRVVVRAWKHKKSPSVLHAGLIMHDENSDHTAAAERILRDGEGLF